MSWIVTNWRLKLLSLVLTVGLLGGVAFSENPLEFATVPVKVLVVDPTWKTVPLSTGIGYSTLVIPQPEAYSRPLIRRP